MSIYDYSVLDKTGTQKTLSDYQGKVVLIVNTASKCGLTPQFEGLEALYRKHKDNGLVILGFPSNQFANQEPGDEKSIAEGCLINYGVTFPMFSKIDVNGPDAHPLYKYLRTELPGILSNKVKWNFTKFLVDSEGKPVKRFSPTTTPDKIDQFLEKNILSKN